MGTGWVSLHYSPPSLGSYGVALCRGKGMSAKRRRLCELRRGLFLGVGARLRCCARGRALSAAKGALQTYTVRTHSHGRGGCLRGFLLRSELRRTGASLCSGLGSTEFGFPSLASQWPRRDVGFAKSNLSLRVVGWLAREAGVGVFLGRWARLRSLRTATMRAGCPRSVGRAVLGRGAKGRALGAVLAAGGCLPGGGRQGLRGDGGPWQPGAGWGVYGEGGLVEKHLRGGRLDVLRAGCPRSVRNAGVGRVAAFSVLVHKEADSMNRGILPQSGAHTGRSLREKQSLPTQCWIAGAWGLGLGFLLGGGRGCVLRAECLRSVRNAVLGCVAGFFGSGPGRQIG
ncbi:MAG: hypothetical protein JWR26_4980 [Pedosphaera sp.]|nr:hypothetical protein [Pedosphaera sp.]